MVRLTKDNRRKKCPKQILVFFLNFALLVTQIIVSSIYIIHGISPFSGRPQLPNWNVGHQPLKPTGVKSPLASSERLHAGRKVGSFNGVDVVFRDTSATPLHSTVNCVGDNFGERSWLQRSCEFHNVCFDLDEREFVLFRSPSERNLQMAVQRAASLHEKPGLMTMSISMANNSVSLGGINPKWKPEETNSLKWFPKVIDGELTSGFYELPDNHVMLIYHSMAGPNVGHMIWDDFLPLHSLLSIFQLPSHYDDVILMRYVLDEPLWGGCDFNVKTKIYCEQNYKKLLPLLGINSGVQHTTKDSTLELQQAKKSSYVCARRGAAGIGMLTDHGLKLHGWKPEDYEQTHNLGRGPMLYQFRNYLMNNLGLDPSSPLRTTPPYKIIFSVASSKDPHRTLKFDSQIAAIKSAFANDGSVIVQNYIYSSMHIKDQATQTASASILITVCGGGAVTSMFLPKGASLVLYYPDAPNDEIYRHYRGNNIRLDWDYVNNMGYVRTHWFPIKTMNTESDLDAFVTLIQNEIRTLSIN